MIGIAEDIAERQLAQEALLAEQQRLATIAEVSPAVLHSFRRAPDGTVSFPYGTRRVEQLHRLAPGTAALDARAVFEAVHPDDVAPVVASIEASARTLRPWRAEFRMRLPDGGELWIEGHSSPLADPDGGLTWHGVVSDVTERTRTEQALAENRAAPRGGGGPHGRGPGGLRRGRRAERVERGRAGDARSTAAPCRPPSGRCSRSWTACRCDSSSCVCATSPRAGRRCSATADRASTTQLERRVAERTAELQAAVQELEAFSYSVSHDLRAPLRALDGLSQALMEDHAGLLPEDGRRHMGIIRDTAQRMGQLIDDLLGFSRLGRAAPKRRRVDCAALVRHARDSLAHQPAGRQVELRLGALPEGEADPALLRQVWLDLLGHAIRYSRGREAALVEAGSETVDGTPEYYVRDNGVGIDMKHAHKLFGVFERLHRADQFEGTGVGLAIVQRHGGRVRAQAEPERGASFHVTLG